MSTTEIRMCNRCNHAVKDAVHEAGWVQFTNWDQPAIEESLDLCPECSPGFWELLEQYIDS